MDSKPEHPTRSGWGPHVTVFIVSSVLIGVFVELLSFLGAHNTMVAVAKEAEEALLRFTPWELAGEYIRILVESYQAAYATSDLIQFALFAYTMLFRAPLDMLTDRFHDSTAAGIVATVQIAAGIITAIAVIPENKDSNKKRNSFLILVLGIAIALVATTLLSIPLLALMWITSETLGHLIPASPVAAYGGGIVAFAFAVTGRTAEGGLHHWLSKVLERVISRGR